MRILASATKAYFKAILFNSTGVAIRYIKQNKIDLSKWDKCINASLNGNFYALSWHLDIVSPAWDAIIEDDYAGVMPLLFRRKLIFPEIFSPDLSGQLGVFSAAPVDHAKLMEFCQAIPRKFKRVEIYLNRQNSSTFQQSGAKAKPIFELDLISPYAKAQSKFLPVVHENLSLAEKHRYWVMKHLSLSELDKYFTYEAPDQNGFYTTKLRKIVSQLVHKNRIEIAGVYSSENMLSAISFFVKSSNNVVLLYAHATPKANNINLAFLLLNAFLQAYSGRNITLSFDHLDENWNAELYTAFGAMKTFSNCICMHRGIDFFRPLTRRP